MGKFHIKAEEVAEGESKLPGVGNGLSDVAVRQYSPLALVKSSKSSLRAEKAT